jgi:hypothetical protein
MLKTGNVSAPDFLANSIKYSPSKSGNGIEILTRMEALGSLLHVFNILIYCIKLIKRYVWCGIWTLFNILITQLTLSAIVSEYIVTRLSDRRRGIGLSTGFITTIQ